MCSALVGGPYCENMAQRMHDALDGRAPSAFYVPRAATDSIGAVGYVGQGGSERLKGFIDTKVDSYGEVRNALRIARHGKHMIEREGECARYGFGEATRLSIRFIVSNECMEALKEGLPEIGADLEAVLPVSKNNGSDSIVYIGFNSSVRSPNRQDRQSCSKNLESALELRGDYAELWRRLNEVRQAGHEVRVVRGEAVMNLESDTGIKISSLTRLMGDTFGYSEDEAMRAMTDSDTILAVATAFRGHEAIAMGMIESTSVGFNGGSIRLAELTDCVVREDYRNGMSRGLFLSVTSSLLDHHVREGMNGYDVLFLEANLAKPVVLESFALQGWNARGTLPNHARIEDGLKSLAVMDIGSEELSRVSECVGLLRY